MIEVFVVFNMGHHGRIPLRAFPSREVATEWCVQDAEKYLARKQHPRSGVRPVQQNEIFNLGYDIFPVRFEGDVTFSKVQ